MSLESRWRITCALLVIPFAAILHHAVFYRPTCMLNNFGGDYYSIHTLLEWISRDPSLPWAIVAAAAIYFAGLHHARARMFIAPIFVAFLPLSIWIWDIPLTGRIVCDHLHDERLVLFGEPVRTRYLYMVGFAAYVLLLMRSWLLTRSLQASAPP